MARSVRRATKKGRPEAALDRSARGRGGRYAAIDAFTRSDPYCVHGVWDRIDVHYYRKKR